MSWTSTDGVLRVTVTVPPGTTALIDLPGMAERPEVGSGDHRFLTEMP